MSIVFVDVNIPMYAAGSAHKFKGPSIRFLRRIAEGEIDAVTDAEVFSEILHRFSAIGRHAEGLAIYDGFRQIVPVVLPVPVEAVDDARAVLQSTPRISSRDALHVAIMRREGLTRIASYDEGFDGLKDIRRIQPR